MKNVLIIEDDPKTVSALEIRFQAAGYRTCSAGDAASGLGQAIRLQPDLLLLDISLPAGDGLQLAQKLKRLPETRNVPIIFITGHKDPELRAKVMDLGAAGLFDKPYDADELLAVAGHALGETGTFRRPIACYSPPGHAETPTARKASAKRILIIEDDQKIALALALRLQSAGYETSTAADAVTGVSAAANLRPDLVLLDISMPAGNGFTVAERIRGALAAPTPIIFLTASKRADFRERARDLGASGYFEKPYDADALLAAVHQQIGG